MQSAPKAFSCVQRDYKNAIRELSSTRRARRAGARGRGPLAPRSRLPWPPGPGGSARRSATAVFVWQTQHKAQTRGCNRVSGRPLRPRGLARRTGARDSKKTHADTPSSVRAGRWDLGRSGISTEPRARLYPKDISDEGPVQAEPRRVWSKIVYTGDWPWAEAARVPLSDGMHWPTEWSRFSAVQLRRRCQGLQIHGVRQDV